MKRNLKIVRSELILIHSKSLKLPGVREGTAESMWVEMEAGDKENLAEEGRTHLPACDGERGAHWNHKVSFASVEDGRSHRNANHQTWGSERRRLLWE